MLGECMIQDIMNMHRKFDVESWVGQREEEGDTEMLKALLHFRTEMLHEEFNETCAAIDNNDPEEIVDGLIDVMVIAMGTLAIFDVNIRDAWEQVMIANMQKEVGVKPSRPNPLKLPDVIKPEGWMGPSHEGNHGILGDIL